MSYQAMVPTIGNDLAEELDDELRRAIIKHGRMNSRHEAYAVILEELDEFWDEVRAQEINGARCRHELLQVAAMALRAIKDLRLEAIP